MSHNIHQDATPQPEPAEPYPQQFHPTFQIPYYIMTDPHVTRVKKTRKSTPHSKGGCHTCKVRRVKCDERKPSCRRCIAFGIACDGYPPSIPTIKETSHSTLRNTAFLPRPAVPASILTTIFDNNIEQNYFDLWHRNFSTSNVHEFLDSGSWTRLIVRSCHIPAIKYGVIAVGALGLAFAEAQTQRNGARALVHDSNTHHEAAVKYYNKAIRLMRQNIDDGTQDLRTTLMTCLIILCFESFHGNYPLAVAQIRTGTELISEWRASLVGTSSRPTVYPSPNPDAIEHELVQAFDGLTVQTSFNPDPRPFSRRQALRDDGLNRLRNMPSSFPSIAIARSYLELTIKSITVFLSITSARTRSENDPNSSPRALRYAKRDTPEQISSFDLPNIGGFGDLGEAFAGDLPLDTPAFPINTTEFQNADLLSQALHNEDTLVYGINEMKREENLARFRQWYQAYKSTPGRVGLRGSPGRLLLTLHYKAAIFAIESVSLDSMAYDNFLDEMTEIVILCERVLEEFQKSGVPFFTPDMGYILPLYVVGMKCRFPEMRTRIINLLLRQPRREGVWDSVVAGKTIEWIKGVEEEFMENGVVPRWARAEPVNTSFDLQERRGTVVCFQRSGPQDPIPRKREAVLTW